MATVNDSISALLGQTRMPALFRQPAAPRMPTPAAPPAPAAAMPAPMQAQPQPEAPATPRVTASDIMAAQEEEFGTRQGLLERQGDILAAEAEFKAGAAAERAGGMAAGEQAFQAELQPTVEQLREANRIAAEQRFAPSQRTAQENMALFGLISVMGMAIGAGGKKNSMAALSAMNGMVEGVRKGDMDRYTREKQVFETNLKNLRDTARSIESELKNVIVPLATSNKEEARLKLQELLARKEASFLKQYADKFALPQLINLSENISKGLERAFQQAQRLESAEEQARIRAQGQLAAQQARALQPPAQRAAGVGRGQLYKDDKGDFYAASPQGFVKIPKPEGVGALTPAGGRGVVAGQNALTFASRVFGNIEGASKDLVSLARSPNTATAPIFSGLTSGDPNTVLSSLTALGARSITPQEERVFQQLSDQLGAALSRLEAQGLATGATKANIAAFNAMRPGAGDAAINMAVYLARVKQEIETGVNVHEEMPGATEGQKRKAKEALQRINRAIPFDIDQVLDVARQNQMTLSDKMVRLLGQPFVARNLGYEGMTVYDNDGTRRQAPGVQLPSSDAVEAEMRRRGLK